MDKASEDQHGYKPSEDQKRFFERNLLEEDSTILTLKVVNKRRRGFSVNIRGPFILADYKFNGHEETVIDAKWAKRRGAHESDSHVHCCWTEVQFARRSPTNQAVQQNIGYQWEVSFFRTEEDAKAFTILEQAKDLTEEGSKKKNDLRLFWFYLENDNHKAVRNLPEGQLVAVA